MKSVNDLYRFLENLSELCWGVHFMLSKDETPNDKTLLTKLTMDLINFYAMLSDLEISFVCRCKHIGFTENQGNGVCDAVESLKQGDISALLAISDIGNSIPNIESVAGNMIDNLVELPNYVLAYIDEILLAATDKGSQNIFKKIVDKSGFMDLFIDKTLTLEQPYFEALENVNSPKVVLNKNMNALYFSRSIIPYQRNAEKCEWLKNHIYYKHIGLYAYRLEVLKEITALPQSSLELAESLEQLRWLENGYTIKAGITEVETIGIDTPQDLERAERFLLDRAAK